MSALQNTKLKICAGASAGGHMNQLLKLLQYTDSWPHQPSLYLTTLDVLATKLEGEWPVYVIGECNRNQPIDAIRTFLKCIKIAIREKPDVVVTTGSMPMALFCIVAKLFGAKVIWIDSIANIEQFSMSGRLTKTFADLFLTQWPELAEKDRKAQYAGTIL